MAARHSPGPWVDVDGVIASQPLDRIVMVKPEDGEPRPHHEGLVALVYGHFLEDGHYTHDDNQRLIAAAPDLYASLKALLTDIDTGLLVRDITRDGDPGWSQHLLQFVQRLQAAQVAIAKAEGQSTEREQHFRDLEARR